MRINLCVLFAIGLLAGGCAQRVDTTVTRFHQGHIPLGATFTVVPGSNVQAGPEFAQYARLVGEEMTSLGYREADAAAAELEVAIDYGVSEGRTKITSSPGHAYPIYSYHVGFHHHPFRYGFYDPFFYGGYPGPAIRSETVYTRSLSMRITDVGDDQVVFEGRAVSEGPTAEIAVIMPYLVESMFRNFPGESGSTKIVQIETQDGKRY